MSCRKCYNLNTKKNGSITSYSSLITHLIAVLMGGAGSEKINEGRAKLRKAFLKHSKGCSSTTFSSSILTCNKDYNKHQSRGIGTTLAHGPDHNYNGAYPCTYESAST